MIRPKIDAHLKASGLTQAVFCSTLLAQFHGAKAPKQVTPAQLGSFRRKSGYDAGNTTSVFYSAYVYFEKLRIKQGEPKSEDRLHMEKLWGKRGFDVKKLGHLKRLFVSGEEVVTVDHFGEFTIMRRGKVTCSGPL